MLRFLIILASLFVATAVAIQYLGVNFGNTNYWDYHGLFLLGFLTFFPRLTLFFSSIPFGGLFWWLGFIFCPRYLVAILATLNYWHQNPILTALAWFIAIGGETTEKYYVARKGGGRSSRHQVIDVEAEVVK